MKKPILLCILDGYGLGPNEQSNAIFLAKKPNIDYLFANYSVSKLDASGEAVGLPDNQMGNSEVGHLNIGAGRVVYQALTLINKNIKNGQFYQNEYFLKAIEHAKKENSKMHLLILLSDGGVHSHINHLIALIKMMADNHIDKLYLHLFLDGRDVKPQTSCDFIKEVEENLNKYGVGQIATISGRYYAMDRDKNIDRVAKAYLNMLEFSGNGFKDYKNYINSQYQKLVDLKAEASDEFVEPGYNLLTPNGKICDNDSIIFANFRPDRAIELSTLLTNPDYYPNQVDKKLKNIYFVGMMKYSDYVIGETAFKIPEISNTLGEVLANRGYHQLRIAETEKYAHVTFFLDGGINFDGVTRKELANCQRILIPSPKVATYDLKPEMSLYQVLEETINQINKREQDVIILNFANCDMVGHTAVKDAVIKAIESVDYAVGQIYQALKNIGGLLILTADHGNADKILDENGKPFTAHTSNLVPFIICNQNYQVANSGKLADIAPTILYLLGEKLPQEMELGEGKNLIIKAKEEN